MNDAVHTAYVSSVIQILIWVNKNPFFFPVITAASSVHKPKQLLHDSPFAMKNSFNFTKMFSPVVFPSSGGQNKRSLCTQFSNQ
jgi:hypothetical protein